jgi:hypothetical protein
MAELVIRINRIVRQIERVLRLGDEIQTRRNYADECGRMRAYRIHSIRLANICVMLIPLIDEYTELAYQLQVRGLTHRHVRVSF